MNATPCISRLGLALASFSVLNFACVLACASASAFAVGADVQAEAPTVKVGDRWTFERVDRRTGVKDAEYIRQVTAVSTAQIEGTENDGKLVMTPELNILDSSTTVITGDSRTLNFPLVVGKSWDYKYLLTSKVRSFKARWQVDAKVVAYEKIRVKAGEFEAFKIEYRGFWNNETDTGRRSGGAKMTSWYAPSARCVVQYEYNDGFEDSVRQLVEFELQP